MALVGAEGQLPGAGLQNLYKVQTKESCHRPRHAEQGRGYPGEIAVNPQGVHKEMLVTVNG